MDIRGININGVALGDTISSGLYTFSTFTFTSNVVGQTGPTLGNLYNYTYAGANTANPWITNTNYFTVLDTWPGYQIWTVPATGSYRITAAGSRSGLTSVYSGNVTYGNAYGRGAIVQGVFTLTKGQKITILPGQPSGNTFQVSTYSSPGGGGGSFVVLGNIASDTFANLTPLIIGGGGGAPGAWTSNTFILPGGYGVTTKRGGNSAGNIGATATSLRFGAPGGVNGQGGNTRVNVSGTLGTNGFDSGGGGGWFGNGITWSGTTYSNVRLTAQGSFGGGGMSFLSNAIGGTYSTSYVPPATSFGGFGGGGGYSGGGGGFGGGSTQIDSGGGGGSYIDANATSVATSDGQFDLSSTFNGASITNLGTYNNAAGYISIVKI